MNETDRRLLSWEAAVPGVVFPPLALWLSGGDWSDRGMAAAANLAPFAILALLAWRGGRRPVAVQGAATFAYAIAAAGWVGASWELAFLALPGAHAELWTPLVAAAVALFVFTAVWFVEGFAAPEGPTSEE
ncbi:MAG: hypothetical protein KJP18_08550 [Gemmatimonadetes bacterium]|nr:hypothetical protein [Gemmatimonadota bacterium]